MSDCQHDWEHLKTEQFAGVRYEDEKYTTSILKRESYRTKPTHSYFARVDHFYCRKCLDDRERIHRFKKEYEWGDEYDYLPPIFKRWLDIEWLNKYPHWIDRDEEILLGICEVQEDGSYDGELYYFYPEGYGKYRIT